MKPLRLLAIAFAAAIIIAPQSAHAGDTDICIVPKPLSITDGEGSFAISSATRISIGDKSLGRPAEMFAEDMNMELGGRMTVSDRKSRKSISLNLDQAMESEEYRLEVDRNGISVCGGSEKGVFYALQSLKQLIICASPTNGRAVLQAATIIDKPRFAYRGAMLDVCRHKFTTDEVKRYIDILALHKINTFHWHLTDDQGWRIEIKRYPELTQTGAMRKQTLVGRYRTSKDYDGTPYGGYFTQDEIRDVVKYAAERYITVIPEIEMPGHAVAALATYPKLGCTGGPYEVRTTWGISEDVFCAGSEETFEFIENVLTEVLELFPSEYIHIGGDECPKVRWKACPKCQRRISEEGLANEAELQSYFMKRIERWLNGHGRKIIGWDEILQGGITRSATIMSWRGTKGGIAAAALGNRVIMSPNTYCYIDYYQTENPEANREPLANGRRPVTMEKLYSFEPLEGLTEEQGGFIAGVQVNLWTEYIKTFDHAQRMLLPRLAALSEVGWSDRTRDLDDFRRRMRSLRRVYDREGYVYSTYFFDGTDTGPDTEPNNTNQ